MADNSFLSSLGQSRATLSTSVTFNEVQSVLIEYAKLIASRAVQNLDKPTQFRPSGANASGDLSESIQVSPVKFMGGIYSIEITMLNYWKWVEDGRKPGKQPPLDKIVKWIKDKQLRLDDGGRTKKGYKREGTLISKSKKSVLRRGRSMSILEARARDIAEKIGKYGTRPTNFLSDAIDDYRDDLVKNMAKALKKDVVTIINSTKNLEAK